MSWVLEREVMPLELAADNRDCYAAGHGCTPGAIARSAPLLPASISTGKKFNGFSEIGQRR